MSPCSENFPLASAFAPFQVSEAMTTPSSAISSMTSRPAPTMLEFSTVSRPATLPEEMMRLTAPMAVSSGVERAISSRSAFLSASLTRSAIALR